MLRSLPAQDGGRLLTQDEMRRLTDVLPTERITDILGDDDTVRRMVAYDPNDTRQFKQQMRDPAEVVVTTDQMARLRDAVHGYRAEQEAVVREATSAYSVAPRPEQSEVIGAAIRESLDEGAGLHTYFKGLAAQARDPRNDQVLQALNLVFSGAHTHVSTASPTPLRTVSHDPRPAPAPETASPKSGAPSPVPTVSAPPPAPAVVSSTTVEAPQPPDSAASDTSEEDFGDFTDFTDLLDSQPTSGVLTESGTAGATSDPLVTSGEFRAEQELTQNPKEFLGSNVLTMDLDQGLALHAPGLDTNARRAFIRGLADPALDQHRFVVVTDGRRDTNGLPVYAMAPAVEWYARHYAGVKSFGLPADTLPAVRGDHDYVEAAFVPYLTGPTSDPERNIGHTDVPRNPDSGSGPGLVVTPAMNGCAFVVTRNPDPDRFTVWHYQSPESNIRHPVDFRRAKRPTDWFGHGEYYRGDLTAGDEQLFEVANMLWHGPDGWEILSQENQTSAKSKDSITFGSSATVP